MNYRTAKQRVGSGKWDYTCNNYPTGYCCEYREIDPEVIPISESQLKEYRDTAHKHHTDGHETAEEAQDCYKEYLLDHHLRFGKMSNQQLKCHVCQEWSQQYAEIDCEMFTLCKEHCNRETVEKIYKAPSQSWSSW